MNEEKKQKIPFFDFVDDFSGPPLMTVDGFFDLLLSIDFSMGGKDIFERYLSREFEDIHDNPILRMVICCGYALAIAADDTGIPQEKWAPCLYSVDEDIRDYHPWDWEGYDKNPYGDDEIVGTEQKNITIGFRAQDGYGNTEHLIRVNMPSNVAMCMVRMLTHKDKALLAWSL